jgi:hypothetical protein
VVILFVGDLWRLGGDLVSTLAGCCFGGVVVASGERILAIILIFEQFLVSIISYFN